MYWVQTAYNLNNIIKAEGLLDNCEEKGIKQIIVGDEGPYAWVELDDYKRKKEIKTQIIYATYKKEGEIEVLWLFDGDALRGAAKVEKMYREKKFYRTKNVYPIYIPNIKTTKEVHEKTINWLKKVAKEYAVMETQENGKVFEQHSFLNNLKMTIHRVRALEVGDIEITAVRRKINGEKEVIENYNEFLKPEEYLKKEEFAKTKERLSKIKSLLPLSTVEKEMIRKMEYWDNKRVDEIKLTKNWDRFFNGEVKLPETEKERKKIQLLCTIAGKGFNKKYGKENKEALEKLKNELTVVVNLGFYEYFLMVQDFIEYAKQNEIKIGQRGSVIGSVLAYCLDITDVDPIEYGLKFERFLTIDRADKPDIDIDVQASRLKDLLNYIKEKYGEKNVAKIFTFTSFGLRIAINNVRKTMGIKDKIEEWVPKIDVTLAEFLLSEEFDNVMAKFSAKGYKNVMEQAIKLAELPKNYSVHTAGIIISDDLNRVPVVIKDGEQIIPFSKNAKQIERMGFIKFDFLSAPILDVIMEAKKLIGKDFEIPPEDKKAFETIGSENSYGIFQIKSRGIKEIAKEIAPKNLADVMDILALYRPGPKDEYKAYIKNKKTGNYLMTDLKGELLVETKVLEGMLKRTNGILIYQEQIMEMSEIWAGFTKEESDNFRVSVSSKNKKMMEKQRQKFIEKSLESGRTKQTTEKIFEIIKKFAEYGFGKSHAAGYAIRTYETAFLKAHYTNEFMIALANESLLKKDEVVLILNEMKRLKMPIGAPKLNEMTMKFEVRGEKISFSLIAIKGIGTSDAKKIEESGIKKVKTQKEFMENKSIHNGIKETLIKAGTVDYLGDRWLMLKQLQKTKPEYQKQKTEQERKVIYKKWEKELIRFG